MALLSLLSTPKIGVIDSWCPIIWQCRNRNPDWRVALVLPHVDKVGSLNPSDSAVKLMLNLTDLILVSSRDAQLYSVNTIEMARLYALPQQVLKKFLFFLPPMLSRVLLKKFDAMWRFCLAWHRDGPRHPSSEIIEELKTSAILYDFQGKKKDPMPALVHTYFHGNRYSVNHGPRTPHVSHSSPKDYAPQFSVSDIRHETRAYASSTHERDNWANKHGLNATQLTITGVPRHDRPAINWYVKQSKTEHALPWSTSVFLASRPSNKTWLTPNIKLDQINVIYKFCRINNLGLIVRCHPSEKRTEIRRALPSSEAGKSWLISDAHPLHIAEHAVFGVVFYSSVAIDLLVQGAPTIEFQLGAFPGESAERIGGLVVPADSVSEFNREAANILENRAAIVAQMQTAKLRLFADATGAIDLIASDIECGIKNSVA